MYLHFFTLKSLKKFLRPLSLTELAKQNSVMTKAKTLVSYYYYILPYAALIFVSNPISTRQNFEPFWPVAWSTSLEIDYVTFVILLKLLFVAIAVLGALFHKHLFFRVLVFLVIFQVHALESSFGSINHQWYLWLYTSFIFMFLPNIWNGNKPKEDSNRTFLLHIWFAQAMAMLVYTMAGFWKFIFTIQQYAAGEVHGLSVQAFAYQVANWVPRLQSEAILAPFVVANPEMGWPLYVGLHFLQIFALWTMVRTSLQQIWVAILVVFHIGTFLTMGISFHPLIILVIILFFGTPFSKERMTLKDFIYDLPLLGHFLELFKKNKEK